MNVSAGPVWTQVSLNADRGGGAVVSFRDLPESQLGSVAHAAFTVLAEARLQLPENVHRALAGVAGVTSEVVEGSVRGSQVAFQDPSMYGSVRWQKSRLCPWGGHGSDTGTCKGACNQPGHLEVLTGRLQI